jgi:hypothetical protein
MMLLYLYSKTEGFF